MMWEQVFFSGNYFIVLKHVLFFVLGVVIKRT